MKVLVSKNSKELGAKAAAHAAEILRRAIDEKGVARLILSTGASQFDTITALIKENLDWNKVEMFHLDEYINLPESHPASFRKYLKERFTAFVNLKKAHFVDGEGDVQENIRVLTEELLKQPVDLGLIGIGENAHIAFNDPPANFDTKDAYIIVDLDEQCKKQQIGEGWFKTLDDVPKQAISMSVYQIMQCRTIISCVPYKVKANAIKLTLEKDLTNTIPATMLKEHNDITIYLDEDSASTVDKAVLNKYICQKN